jgi:transmembrane sensor
VQIEDSHDAVNEQASAWVIRLQAQPSATDLERFEAWRAQGQLYSQAYELALAAWTAVGEHAASPRLLAMRRDALERARRASTRWDRRVVAAGVCFLILAPIAGLGWYKLRAHDELEFQTRRGEQRVIVLSDGSRMSLDALSRVEVKYTSDVRGIELTSGRANFEVAKDVTRPLKVHAGPRTVTALGTVFTVEREPQEVVVTLVEGHVAVTSRDRPMNTMEMRPRQQLRMTDSGTVTLRDGLDTAQALAWREGKLIFDNEPLTRVVARMNNYGATPIQVEGKANDLHISGVFKAGDTTAFVDAMQSYFALTAERQENAITIRSTVSE